MATEIAIQFVAKNFEEFTMKKQLAVDKKLKEPTKPRIEQVLRR